MGTDKQILQGVTVAVAGPLGPGWTDADVARWLGYHGGRFAPAVTDDVTHLLCTAKEYTKPRKKQSAALRAAMRRRRGPGRVHIVLRDWLEDSLHRRRRLREGLYRLGRQADQGTPKTQGILGEVTGLYHIYRDAAGFAYRVTIRRDDEAAGIVGERYVLHLFESHALPHLYWFVARHYKSRVHTQGRDYRPSGSCQVFSTEYGHFCVFFARKTGVAWEKQMTKTDKTKGWFYVRPEGEGEEDKKEGEDEEEKEEEKEEGEEEEEEEEKEKKEKEKKEEEEEEEE